MHSLLLRIAPLLLVAALLIPRTARGAGVQIFAKGSVSKNYSSHDRWTVSVSASGGLAITLLSQIHLEARYTNMGSLQNTVGITNVGTLTDLKTQTNIYSLGLDIDILGDKANFQPFIFLGAGFLETESSFYFTPSGSSSAIFVKNGKQSGLSGSVGLGFKIRIAKQLSFEIEILGHSLDLKSANPLVNLYANLGIRLFV